MVHLASQHLSPNGYVVFNGGCPEIFTGANAQVDFVERIARSVSTKQGFDLSIDKQEENIVYANAGINIMLYPRKPVVLKQAFKKSELKQQANKTTSIASLIKLWAAGDNRPENGSILGFDVDKSGKVCLPKYY